MNRLISFLFLVLIQIYFLVVNRVLHGPIFSYIRDCFAYSYLRYFGVETEFGYVTLVGLPIVHRHKNSRIILGKGVTLVSNSKGNVAGVNHPVVLATLTEEAVIHLDGCGVSGSSICAATSIKIGRYSGLGANSCVYDTDFHVIDPIQRMNQVATRYAKTAPITIGENVWVAASVLILKGVTIADNAVVGAGAVITSDVPPGTIVAGNPARIVRRNAAYLG